MDSTEEQWPHSDVTQEIIGASFRVHNTIGSGHREQVYQKALASEMRVRGLFVEEQYPVKILYHGEHVGDERIDFCVNERVLVEIKSTERFRAVDFRQVNGYLQSTNLQIGLLIAFGHDKVKIKRVANLVSNP